ncbi:MAG: hypothetical protein K2K25_01845, partial [Muribaculaceae bacterium]|nr:hypothetical protein [Muribaculaceae bacterium]
MTSKNIIKISLRFILPFLAILLLPEVSLAGRSLDDEIKPILRLRLPSEQVADSAMAVLRRYNQDNNGDATSSIREECINVIEDRLLPFALKHEVGSSIIAYMYDELGRMQMALGSEKGSEAMSNFRKGIPYAEKAEDWFRVGRILEHMGFYEIKFGDRAKGFDLSQQAIDAYRKSHEDADRYITRCYYMLAIVYLHLGDMDGLKKVISDMEAFIPNVREKNRVFHLYNLYSVQEVYYGNLQQETKDPEKRKEYARMLDETNLKTVLLIDSAPKEWGETSVNPAWNYYNRASMFVNIYDRPPMDSVIYYCDKAMGEDHFKKKGEKLEVWTSATTAIAEGWMKNGDYLKARGVLLSALEKMKTQDNVNNLVQDRVQMYELLKDIAAHFGKMEDALAYSDSVRMLEKERFSLETANAVKEHEVKYKTQETELALAKSEARRSNTLMWLFVALGVILAVVIAFLTYADLQRRRRLKKELEFAALRADIGRQLTQQYVEGLENERRRMARELHDGVCNDLLAIQMSMADGKTKENTVQLLDSCRESVRRISHELMPPEFSYASLDEVVRFFVRKQADANSGKIDLSYVSTSEGHSWEDVPDSVSLEIYRIVQEAVGNAVKHSGCDTICVELNWVADT